MSGKILLTVLLVIVLIAGAAGIAGIAYRAGLAQGMADSGKLAAPSAPPSGAAPYPIYGPMFWGGPWHWGFGFGLFGLLGPILFLFLVFGLIRALIWRPRWGGHGAPPMFDEWHRRAHEPQPPEK